MDKAKSGTDFRVYHCHETLPQNVRDSPDRFSKRQRFRLLASLGVTLGVTAVTVTVAVAVGGCDFCPLIQEAAWDPIIAFHQRRKR